MYGEHGVANVGESCAKNLWLQLGDDIDGGAAGDYSGEIVSLSSDGSTVAIASQYSDGAYENAGHVRIYQLDGATWTQLGDDLDGEAANDYSGSSVSLSSDGLTVAIGAQNNDGSYAAHVHYNVGHVRIYQFDGAAWNQVGGDIDGEAYQDSSGSSVSLSSDGLTVAIGAYMNDGAANQAGHVRVYQLDGATWTQVGGDIDGEAAVDRSGLSVSLSSDGSTVAIGAYGNDGTGSDSGHVRVYQLDGATWTQLGGDIDGEAAGDWSGS